MVYFLFCIIVIICGIVAVIYTTRHPENWKVNGALDIILFVLSVSNLISQGTGGGFASLSGVIVLVCDVWLAIYFGINAITFFTRKHGWNINGKKKDK